MVTFPEVALKVTMPPSVKVTSVPLEEVNVTGEPAPEKARSVPPPEVAAIVTIPFRPVPEVVRVMLAPSTSCRLPPELLSVTVCEVASEVFAIVCNSFEVEPSTSDALIVIFPELALRVTMPPWVKVTSVPVEEVRVTGEEVPEYARSVEPPPPLEAIVTIPFRPVPEVVRVMLAPSTSCRLPPELLSVAVCEVASEVFAIVCNSFEVEPSISVAPIVIVPPFELVLSVIVAIPVT